MDKKSITTPIAFIAGKISAENVSGRNQDKVTIHISKIRNATAVDTVIAVSFNGGGLLDGHYHEYSLTVSPRKWYVWVVFGQATSGQQEVSVKQGETANVDFQFQ